MTHPSTIARDSAQHCEAKKHGLRQTQDGIVVSFVLHPNEVPAALQLASLGTRYMLALVEIGDDERPITGKEADANSLGPQCSPETGQHKTTPAPERVASVRAQPRKWDEITPAQQAGIRCNEPAFVRFLAETYSSEIKTTANAEQFVREYCQVQSRSEIRIGRPLEIWNALDRRYALWRFAPKVGAA